MVFRWKDGHQFNWRRPEHALLALISGSLGQLTFSFSILASDFDWLFRPRRPERESECCTT